MTYQDFKNQVLGNGYNVDGFAGNQCWDLYAKYCIYLGIPYANCNVTGYVRDIYEQRAYNGVLNYFSEVDTLQAGDLVIFPITPETPYSHIAIFDSDNNGTIGNFLGQNQGGYNGNTNIVALHYSNTYAKGLRPKKFVTDSVPEPSRKEYDEKGTFTLSVDLINVRRQPSTKEKPVASYVKGQSVIYDHVIIDFNGFVWISYIGKSGKRNYLATGQTSNGKRIGKAWGTFK